MAQYDHGVKFDYTSRNDGFVSHVARRGAEKTATGGVWLLGLVVIASIWGLGKALIHSLGIWLLVIAVGVIALLLIYKTVVRRSAERKMEQKRAATPWAVTYTCADGTTVTGADRYVTKEDAVAGAAKFQTIRLAGGVSKTLRGYEAWWDGPSDAPATEIDTEGTGFRAVTRQIAPPRPPLPPLARTTVSQFRAAQSAGRGAASTDVVVQLKELVALQRSGVLSETEFARAKARLLGN